MLIDSRSKCPRSFRVDQVGRHQVANLLYLSHRDVERLLDPAEVVEIAEVTLREQAAGAVVWATPRLAVLRSEDMKARYRVKMAALSQSGVAGIRVTGSGPTDSVRRPRRFVLLSDATTAEFVAIVDERWSYALRTAAGVAVAFRYLAPKGLDTVGIVGAGEMAWAILQVMQASFNVRKAVVTSRRPETREALAVRAKRELDMDVTPVATPKEVLQSAPATVVATTATKPLIDFEDLPVGATVYSMGQHQELHTPAYFACDKLVVDDWLQVLEKADFKALVDSGSLDRSHVHAEFVELVTGAKPGRENPQERIVVRSEGLVTMDVAISNYMYRKALELGVGQVIST